MTTYEPLIVPIEVEALVATPNIRTSETWYRSELDLHALAENDSIDPDPFAGSAFFSDESQTDYDGNYVMWRLPDSLRHGHQNDETGTIEFPKIPNRWLVLRYSGKRNGKKPDTREATAAFLIESDYLTGDDTKEGSEIEGTSAYVDNRDGQMKITSIGRRFDLDLAKPEHPGWQEKRATRNLFLNAMGPGHVAFTAYQSYNEDVLSFHDDLKDITDDGEVVYYSYCVIGWYSNASFDPLNIPHTHGIGHLTTIDRVAAILNEYGWKADSTDTIEGSLYAGTCLAVPSDGAVTHDDATNDTAGHLYEDARPVPESVTVAVGETVQDALQALPTFGDDHTGIHGQGDSHWIHDQVTGALLYRTVEYLGTVDGPVRTEHQAHSTAFSRESGGYTWQLLPTKDNDAPSTIPAVLLPALTELETAQTAEEHATVRLAEAQQALTDLWWLKGKLASDKDQLPADRKHFKDTYEQRRADQIAEVKRLQDQLARAKRTLHEKEQTLDALTKKQGEDWRIQRAPKSQFTTAHDPVIALKGAKVNRPLTRKDHLPCRLDHDTVISLTIGTDPVTITKPVPGQHLASCLPSRFTATAVRLLHEFALLDQAACTLTAKNTTALTAILDHPDHKVTGHLPEYTRMWNQPWSPLFLLWKVGCYPIPYTNALSDPHPTWTFDGTTYQWSGKGASSNEQTITGRSLLTPLPAFLTSANTALINQGYAPDSRDGALLNSLEEGLSRLDVLSQTLHGFNNWFLQRQPLTHRTPGTGDHDIHTLLAAAEDPLMHAQAVPDLPVFQAVRAAQIRFDDVAIVDAFGRAVPLNVGPTHTIFKTRPVKETVSNRHDYELVELPPRILLPARVRFEAAGAADHPVNAWLLVSHLDRALLIYLPDGQGLGLFRVNADNHDIHWNPLPGPIPHTTLKELLAKLPDGALKKLLTQFSAIQAHDFTALLSTIDRALQTITRTDSEEDSLPFLAGRPIALVQTNLSLELKRKPDQPVDWKPGSTHARDILKDQWFVRLGETNLTTDGTIGYFVDDDFAHLRTTHLDPQHHQQSTYLTYTARDKPDKDLHIQAHYAPSTPTAYTQRTVTLLMEPFRKVHAITDIIPVTTFELPTAAIREALERLHVAFITHPVLTPHNDFAQLLNSSAFIGPWLSHPDDVVMPRPTAWHHEWSWAEPNSQGTGWNQHAITAASSNSCFPTQPAIARSGFLQILKAYSSNHKK